mmetsp:Transcript_35159/g.89846  ORF Transcript_35159/g.89846 Transcript_35159/m.89846 type:complete len:433 (+) Transcript_35159:1137-2435(+)
MALQHSGAIAQGRVGAVRAEHGEAAPLLHGTVWEMQLALGEVSRPRGEILPPQVKIHPDAKEGRKKEADDERGTRHNDDVEPAPCDGSGGEGGIGAQGERRRHPRDPGRVLVGPRENPRARALARQKRRGGVCRHVDPLERAHVIPPSVRLRQRVPRPARHAPPPLEVPQGAFVEHRGADVVYDRHAGEARPGGALAGVGALHAHGELDTLDHCAGRGGAHPPPGGHPDGHHPRTERHKLLPRRLRVSQMHGKALPRGGAGALHQHVAGGCARADHLGRHAEGWDAEWVLRWYHVGDARAREANHGAEGAPDDAGALVLVLDRRCEGHEFASRPNRFGEAPRLGRLGRDCPRRGVQERRGVDGGPRRDFSGHRCQREPRRHAHRGRSGRHRPPRSGLRELRGHEAPLPHPVRRRARQESPPRGGGGVGEEGF